MITFILLVSSTSASAPPGWPPRATPFQVALHAKVAAAAAPASAAALSALEHRLEEPAFKDSIKACCPQLVSKTGAELAAMLQAELEVAELTHNFNANSTGTWEGDINITAGWLRPHKNWLTSLPHPTWPSPFHPYAPTPHV